MSPEASRSSTTTISEKSTSSSGSKGFWISIRAWPTSQSSQKLNPKSWAMIGAVASAPGQVAGCAAAGAAADSRAQSPSNRRPSLLPSAFTRF